MPVASNTRKLLDLSRKLRAAVKLGDASYAAEVLRAMNVVDSRLRFDLNSGALCLEVQGTTHVPTSILHFVDCAFRCDGPNVQVLKQRDGLGLPRAIAEDLARPTCWDRLLDDGD